MNKKSLLVLLNLICSLGFSQTYLKVGNITITGNAKTHKEIILRELSFKVGDTLDVRAMEPLLLKAKQNITNTNLFVTSDVFYNSENQVINVFVVVKERWYFVVLPEILLADRSFNEWWYDRGKDLTRLTYGVNAKHFNLTGNNDQLKLKVMGGFVPFFELSYSKPYIDKRKRIGIRTGAFYSTQRTMAYRTWNDKLDFYSTEKRMRERYGAMFELRLRNAFYHFHSIYLGYSISKIADSIAIKNSNYFGENVTEQRAFNFIYDYRYDKRDNRQYPLKGKMFYTQLTNTLIGRSYNQTSLLAFYTSYLDLGSNFYLESSIRAKTSTPRKQFYPWISGLGYGNNLVRGYELYVVDGQHFGLFKNTLKYQLIKTTLNLKNYIKLSQFNTLPIAIYPNIYYDLGYIKNHFPIYSNSKLSNKLLSGGGIGLDFVTWYNTTVKTYYSVNQMGEKRFYFGVMRDF